MSLRKAEDSRKSALIDAAELKAEQLTDEIQSIVLECTTDAEAELRFHALEAIAHWAHRQILPNTQKFLDAAKKAADDVHARVRSEAAVVLVLIEEPPSDETLSILLNLLSDEHPRVRQEAAAALGDAKSKGSVSALCNALQDEDEQTRFEVAFALATLGDASGLSILLEATDSSTRRFDALEGIRRLGDDRALEVLRPLTQRFLLGWPERLTVYATMYHLGETSAAAFLIERAQSKRLTERRLAIGLIATHGVSEAAPTLLQMVEDASHSCRIDAIHALAELKDKGLLPLLQKIIDDNTTSEALRGEAKDALKRYS